MRMILILLIGLLSLRPTLAQDAEAFARLVDKDAPIEQLAKDLEFTEGPVWDDKNNALLFSDIPANTTYKWTAEEGLTIFRTPSNNANGLMLDEEGNLLMAEHSGRKIGKLSPEGEYSALVEDYKGTSFNSPNDLIMDSKGILYFTDPPYGLPEDATDTLGFNGVYQYRNGKVTLITKELDRPNGVALSPDERTLYVANSGTPKKFIKFPVSKNGKVGKSELFYDVSGIDKPGNPDGVKVDSEGNIYGTGPGGIWVFSSDGKHLGTIEFPETPANLTFGGPDRKTLFVTAQTGLYRMPVKVAGKP